MRIVSRKRKREGKEVVRRNEKEVDSQARERQGLKERSKVCGRRKRTAASVSPVRVLR